MLEKTKIMCNKHGTLFKISKLVENKFVPIILTINNVELLFDIQRNSSKIFLKWKLKSIVDIDKIQTIENSLNISFGKNINSNLISKPNYPIHLLTQIKLTKNGASIISDDSHQIESYEEFITKNNKYNLVLEIKNVFEKTEIINYSIIIKKISLAL